MMKQQISPAAAAIAIGVAVVLVLAIGYYVMNRPQRLSYPPNFNPAGTPSVGSVGR